MDINDILISNLS